MQSVHPNQRSFGARVQQSIASRASHIKKHTTSNSTTLQGLELGEGVDDEGVALGDGAFGLDCFDDDCQVSKVQVGLFCQVEQKVKVCQPLCVRLAPVLLQMVPKLRLACAEFVMILMLTSALLTGLDLKGVEF